MDRIESNDDVVGQMAYNTAPEILKGEKHTQASDCYLLGVLIHELLTGKVPFYKFSKAEFYQNMQEGELIFHEVLTETIKDLLSKLLERDPSKRFNIKDVQSHELFKQVDWDSTLMKEHRMPPA